MNDETLGRLEAEAGEMLRTAKELFGEFERRLGEAVSAQRLANSEARTEAAEVQVTLRQLVKLAEAAADAQREALDELSNRWWFYVEEEAQHTGADMARGFGEEIAAGLEKRLKDLGERVERATGRFRWTTALTWGIGIGLGMVLTIAIGVWAFIPRVSGLTDAQVRAAIAHLAPCQVDGERHVCIRLDDRPRMSKLSGGVPAAVVRDL
jgi:tetrahydromethanopterin S-methyltransferase subunit G